MRGGVAVILVAPLFYFIKNMAEKYKNFLKPSSQFVMCGNCFRMDTYKGCGFGCSYCFANNRGGGNFFSNFQIADMQYVRNLFDVSINKGDCSTIKRECLNHYVPIHLGGLSDPFQPAEWRYGVSYDFLSLTKEYNYPVNISTKTASLPDKYWDILNPNIHTFSLSIMGYSDSYIRIWEKNTPSAIDRINFAKKLKEKGFWVSIRIQPIIDMEEVIQLIKATEDYVDFFTVEHLKLPLDNKAQMKDLCSRLGKPIPVVPKGREYEFDPKIKLENINRIKNSTKVKIGCGDNDLHVLSESLNCCGIDTMPHSFKNWLKYNSMYIKMTGDRSQWKPESNCNQCLNGACVIKGFSKYEQYVDKYYLEHYGDDSQLTFNFDL